MKRQFLAIGLLMLSGHAFAQQTPLFQQITARPKGLSNLAEPTQMVDSFLGQDKSGPYVLSWKNIVFSPSYPVWVTIDGTLLKSSEFTLNTEKGEISFKSPVKRSQVVNVKYGYFPEVASRNANPALTAPLTVKLASNSYSGLTFTALNSQNLSTAPSMILGYNLKSGGFTSNYYANPTGKGTEIQDALKIGYSNRSKNSFNANYEKSDKGFSSYAKNFGVAESAEKSNISGNYLFSKSANASFNNTSFKSLNSNAENNNSSAQFNFAGTKNQPSFNYSIIDINNVDAKNIKTASLIETTNFASKVGRGDFLYKNNENDITANNVRTVNNQEILRFKVDQLSIGRVSDFKIDPKAGTIQSLTDSLDYNTKISGGTINYSSNQNNSVINNKSIQNDQTNYGLKLNGNKYGFSGLNFTRNENTTSTASSESNVINNRASFGFKTFNYNTNTVVTESRDQIRKDVIDDSLTFSLPVRKHSPLFTFSSIDAIKRNEKGALVGASNDVATLKHNVSGLQFVLKFGQSTNYTPDGKTTSIDNSTGNLSTKIGRGLFVTESLNNQITTFDNKTLNQEIKTFNYSFSPTKAMPGLEFERVDSNSIQDTNLTNTTSDKVKLTSKIGSASLSAGSVLSTTENNSNKQNGSQNNNLNLTTPIWGSSSNLNLTLNNNVNTTLSGEETKNGIGLSLSPNKSIKISTEQFDSKILNGSGQTVNFSNNSKYSLNYNLPGTILQTSINTIETNLNKIEIYDYRAVLGNNKTLFQVDSVVRMRDSTDNSSINNIDTTQTSVNFNTSRNVKITGSYILNPDDPAKPGLIVPVEKRALGLNAKLGNFVLDGTYAALEHLPGTSADVIAKAGGFNLYGESGIKVGYKSGSTSFYSEMKDQFFFGSNLKDINTYSIGLSQNRGDRFNFSLSGTYVLNRNNSIQSQDYRSEAKLIYKF